MTPRFRELGCGATLLQCFYIRTPQLSTSHIHTHRAIVSYHQTSQSSAHHSLVSFNHTDIASDPVRCIVPLVPAAYLKLIFDRAAAAAGHPSSVRSHHSSSIASDPHAISHLIQRSTRAAWCRARVATASACCSRCGSVRLLLLLAPRGCRLRLEDSGIAAARDGRQSAVGIPNGQQCWTQQVRAVATVLGRAKVRVQKD